MVETVKRTAPDAIVIGTGFGGAVTACRLVEAGLRVLVLERGKRYRKEDFPVHPEADIPSVESDAGKREPAAPETGLLLWAMNHGMWEVRDLGEILVAQAAGYGGGSLFYANVHLRPPADAFQGWPDQYNRYNLDPYFDLAAYMLDVKPYSHDAPKLGKTTQLEAAAEALGREAHCFRPPLAVNFGRPLPKGRTEKNRFGRDQGRCELRGECCFGCRAMAKNTLDLNYLALAESPLDKARPPAEIEMYAEVLWIGQTKEGPYEVEYRRVDTGEIHTVRARYVFLCAGAVNSTELLLRSRVAKQLRCPGPEEGLGEDFYPNADSIAVAFDCEGLQEADRGPTITSALLYQEGGRWFLFQDGGMPTDLEPFLGLFRSPLWLGRNRFWEKSGPTPSSRAPRIGYATLPLQSIGDALPRVLPGMLPTSSDWRSPLLQEITEALVEIGRGLRSADQLQKTQLLQVLEANRGHLLESFVVAAEPFVAEAVEQTGRIIEKRLKLSEFLKDLPKVGGLDLSGIEEIETPARLLRLGAQLVWGSQGAMVRDAVVEILGGVIADGPGMVERATNLLRWALDFRMSDGHTGMLLCMGRDRDPPARLSIEIPEPPPIGSIITGEKASAEGESSEEEEPRATGVLLSFEVEERGWALDDAAGALLLAGLSGTFEKGKRLFVGDRWIGEVEEVAPIEIPAFETSASESAGDDASDETKPPVELLAIQFKPPSRSAKVQARAEEVARRNLLEARLHARFPEPSDPSQTPDWATQERILRDIVNQAWGGELRTDPIAAFMRRRLTVHPQGGCPMGRVTEIDGAVIDCPGLYVMDAAAFPKSVGVNPSAAILAVAEYKVERFIRKKLGKQYWRASQFSAARGWASNRWKKIDPLRQIRGQSRLPEAEAIGIRFREEMTGDWQRVNESQTYPITAKLDAEIEDLTRFLERYEKGKCPEIAASGTVELESPAGAETLEVCTGSFIRLFREPAAAGAEDDTHLIEYRLVLKGPQSDGPIYIITGEKTIQDEVGTFDLWKDVTVLEFEMVRDDGLYGKGALEVPPAAFFGDQLQSFEATNTSDPIRRLWALTAFGKLFFGHLLDVYLPEVETLRQTAKCIAERAHV